jgi:hypothetical protein
MATAKKKASAKRTVKYAAKAQSSARQTSASNVRPEASTSWINNSAAADWQKGAQDWAKQSAKLYQLPFAQGDMNEASQKAAETVKSATENAVKMSSEFMSQMFGQQAKAAASNQSFDPGSMFKQFQAQMPQMPNFDMGSAQEKMSSFARESSEQMNKASQGASRAGAEAMEALRENIQTLTEVCNLASGVSKELAAEMISYLNRQFAQNVELSKQALTCRTLNDMFDLSTRITKSNLDGFFSQSVKMSEMLFQCATDVSEPLNDCVSQTSERMAKAMQA